jgi:peroxiredoxin family protein
MDCLYVWLFIFSEECAKESMVAVFCVFYALIFKKTEEVKTTQQRL